MLPAASFLIAVLDVLLFQRLVDDVLIRETLGPLWWIAGLFVAPPPPHLLSVVVSGVDDVIRLEKWVETHHSSGATTRETRASCH